MTNGLQRLITNWFPIREVHQVLFAEALSQAISCGMEISHAIKAAADTSRSRRSRHAMYQMSDYCRLGNSLARSLSKTGIRVMKQFAAALDVGESRGCLADELAAFARSRFSDPAKRLAGSLGRSADVVRFTSGLARLLSDHRLTTGMLVDAAQLAAGEGSSFDRVIRTVVDDVENGDSLAGALRRQSAVFDSFLCTLIRTSESREVLCRTLMRSSDNLVGTERRSVKCH